MSAYTVTAAGLPLALINIHTAGSAAIAWATVARILIDAICARSSILTRIRGTIVDVRLTVISLIACVTIAGVRIDAIGANTTATTVSKRAWCWRW
jgi:hypothetical protein